MSYEYGDSISKDGIKKTDFNNTLSEKHLNEKEKKAAMDIFSKFASLNGDENILDESEQIQARSAFAALDKNQDNKVTKKELKHSPNSNELSKTYSDSGEKTSEIFMETLDISVKKGNKSNIGQVQYGENKPTTYYKAPAQRLPQDQGLTTYHTDSDGRIVEKDNITLNETYIYAGEKDNKYKIDNNPEEKLINNKEIPIKEPTIQVAATETDVKSAFFQYLSNDKTFTGKLKNGKDMELPSGCELIKSGETFVIKFGNNLYKMRGKLDDNKNPLRFECDETKKTLQEALSETKSDDAIHNYHNHGINGNQKSTYDKQAGVISHGSSESAVSQTQTFASMLMNGNDNSTLKLDKQKGVKGETETNGEIILKTINVNNDNGIDMTELVSYLRADQEESKTVKNKSGARKFAGGIDLDAKDLANIGKVFKKYDKDNDGKLNKDELQKLLDDLKQNSMSKLAGKENDKYIGGGKPTEDKPVKTKPKEDTKPEPTKLEGNRKRHIKENSQEVGNGPKEEYYYKKGLRTKVENGTVNGQTTTIADEDSNIAVIKNPLLGKKKFLDIKGLEQNVDARIKKYTVDDKEDTQIVKVKDKNDTIKYYLLNTNKDGTYQLGEELTDKGKKKFISRTTLAKKINTKLGFTDAKIPKEITAKYDDKGTLNIYLNDGPCPENVAKIYIIRYNAQLEKSAQKN